MLQIVALRKEGAKQLEANQRLAGDLAAKAAELQAVSKLNGELENEIDNLRNALEVRKMGRQRACCAGYVLLAIWIVSWHKGLLGEPHNPKGRWKKHL